MRLIDADYAQEQLNIAEFECGVNFQTDCDHVRNFLNAHPTVDAVPVAHGRWEEADDGDGVVCSVCREDFCTIYLETERFNYCPNCGARMDGE